MFAESTSHGRFDEAPTSILEGFKQFGIYHPRILNMDGKMFQFLQNDTFKSGTVHISILRLMTSNQ